MSATWLQLFFASLVASTLGSAHCVGMCLPFAILAVENGSASANGPWKRACAYHLGRLLIYLILGTIVGSLSQTVAWLGLSSILRYAVGFALIAVGVMVLHPLRFLPGSTGVSYRPNLYHRFSVMVNEVSRQWTSILVKIRRAIPRNPNWLGALGWGVTSTLLPCGWLYLFAIAASTAGSLSLAIVIMTAFWLGTLPWLSVATWGWKRLDQRWQIWIRPVGALSLILFGSQLFSTRSSLAILKWLQETASSRSFTEIDAKALSPENLHRFVSEQAEELPCCRQKMVDGVLNQEATDVD
jgi:uncharacterized protein